MTPQELITAAACIQCQIPVGMQQSVSIYLLNEILVNGGGGGGGGGGGNPEVFSLAGSSVPVAAPVGGAGVAYNAVGQVFIYTGGAWALILS